jgi:hypothetical protein
MQPALIPDLPDPEWIQLLRAEQAKGRSVSAIARETGIARSSLSMLLRGVYPAESLDLATRRHGPGVVRLYRQQVLCPHLRRGIGDDECRTHASAPMSTSNHDRIRQWAACRRCALNPLTSEART